MSNLNLGLVGNCQISALIDDKATLVWSCLPQFDADPTFCRLLRDDAERELPGYFDIEVLDYSHSEQAYIANTAILQTTLYDSNGGAVRVTDLAPRYEYVGRVFNPNMLLRRVEPLHGSARIRIRLRPSRDYGANHCEFRHGSTHFR